MRQKLGYVCRSMTTFTTEGVFDPLAFREYLDRFLESDLGIYVASSGSGLGQALGWEDLRQVYRTAVDTCKGKITIGANIPEQYTAKSTIEHAKLAVECGVDMVCIYGPEGRHLFHPTDAEFIAFFERVTDAIKHPIALCPNPSALHYAPSPAVIGKLANEHKSVKAIVLATVDPDDYFIALRDNVVREDLDIFVSEVGSMNTIALGAAGVAGHLAQIIPKTYRRYLDSVQSGKVGEAAVCYADIRRLAAFVGDNWPGGSPRWIMMYLSIFKQPGGAGRLPEPYMNLPESEYERFRTGIIELRITEIEESARLAGLI